MQEIEIFKNEEFGTVRVVDVNGEPYFVGKDVAEILGYSNASKAVLDHVDEEDKCFKMLGVSDSQNGNLVKTALINESGLYSLVLSSHLPAAKRFKRWVTSEVLPAIRKHGLYAIDDILENPDMAIAALQKLKEEREERKRLEEVVAMQGQQLSEMQPKATYYDFVLTCTNALPISIIAKDYGWSATKLNGFLHDKGVQYKMGDTWILYANHADKGYTKSSTFAYTDGLGGNRASIHTKWTQKGRLFIYDLMKSAGNLPLVEQDG